MDDRGINNSITQNSSINNGKSPFNGAYGWGGIEERGYVPMPGITDVSVQYQNNGALTKTTINIKCFSKETISNNRCSIPSPRIYSFIRVWT
jgi:hypothetical protein